MGNAELLGKPLQSQRLRARPTDPKDDARVVCERIGERSDRDVKSLYGDETSHAQEHIRTRRAVPREGTETRVHHVGDDVDGQAGRELPEAPRQAVADGEDRGGFSQGGGGNGHLHDRRRPRANAEECSVMT